MVTGTLTGLMSSSSGSGADSSTPSFDSGDSSFTLISTALLWIMIPGCGLFYSGMATSKSALSLIMLSMWSIAIVSIQWIVVGYSLSFSRTSTPFVGDFSYTMLTSVDYNRSYPTAESIPETLFCFYQGVTACLPTALIIGACAERGRMLPASIFILIWTTFVYDPIASWSLNPRGWSARMGLLDFGGGAPVHVPCAAASLVYSYFLGPRRRIDIDAPPHNMLTLVIGTILIWFGSFGYNAGSAYAPDSIGIMACILANIAGASAGVTWVVLEYVATKRWSAFGFCAGACAGLVGVTTGSGFVSPAAGFVFGVLISTTSWLAHRMKANWTTFDDTLDVWTLHGLAGVCGMILTGVFAQAKYGGAGVHGWVDGNWLQVPIQLADTAAGFCWSVGVSWCALYVMNRIPGLQLRVTTIKETTGIDQAELGAQCYQHLEDHTFYVSTVCVSHENGTWLS